MKSGSWRSAARHSPGQALAGPGTPRVARLPGHSYSAAVVGIIVTTLDDLPVLVDAVRRFLAADDPGERMIS
jgi:hypothetical protein